MSLTDRFQFIQLIEEFFKSQGFMSIHTPPLVENPGMETHIHPFRVKDKYLHTSPEFFIKEILSRDQSPSLDRVYSLSYCFRDEPESPIHRPQFLMLEWYRRNQGYDSIETDIHNMLAYLYEKRRERFSSPPKITTKTMQEIFREFLDVDILKYLEISQIIQLIKNQFSEKIILPEKTCQWDDYFWLLFLNYVEPKLKKIPYLIIKEFPAPLAALSTISLEDPRICERFEFYINGIEVANCFNELTDLDEQKTRFQKQGQLKEDLYGVKLPEPQRFYQALERGLSPSAGIALGIERLMGQILNSEDIFLD